MDKQRSTTHTHKTKDRVTRTPPKTWGELRGSGRVNSSCSTSEIRCVNLVTNPAISHERERIGKCLRQKKNKNKNKSKKNQRRIVVALYIFFVIIFLIRHTAMTTIAHWQNLRMLWKACGLHMPEVSFIVVVL